MEQEIWKPFPLDERYSLSSLGRVRGVYGDILRLQDRGDGRKTFSIYVRGEDGVRRSKIIMVSRAVLETFEGPCPHEGWNAAHKNKINNDNRWANLEWQPPSRVQRETTEMGCHSRGEDRPTAVLTESDVREIRRLAKAGELTQRALSYKFGVSEASIYYIVAGKHWKHVA